MDYQPSYGFLKDCLYRSESYKVTLADAYIEISVSWCGCRYHDPAGFMPRVSSISSGAPGFFAVDRQSHFPTYALLATIGWEKG